MGYKLLSKEQELQLVEEYRQGTPVITLMAKYGYKTKKSITDKVKKYYPNEYQQIIKEAQDGRRGYVYSLKKLTSPFDAYLIGLLMTDGYVLSDRDGVGLDMTDEDVIKFVADTIGTTYNSYQSDPYKTRYRVRITYSGITEEIKRFGIVPRKSCILTAPELTAEEWHLIPYLIRGVIDGDGCVSKTSYGGAQFYICTMSHEFAEWLVHILTDTFFMDDIHCRQADSGLWRVDTSNQYNILKLIALVYNKPFGMNRKYTELRKMFRDYNKDILLDKDDGIVQTTTE